MELISAATAFCKRACNSEGSDMRALTHMHAEWRSYLRCCPAHHVTGYDEPYKLSRSLELRID
jgi:hypothetical protein